MNRLGDGEVAQTNMLGKPDGFGVMDMGREFGVQRGKAACDYRSIKRIGLGQLSLGAGEAAHPCRI
ncbi:hypothetical protein SAMN05428984_0073 [Sphingomonas sp. OK281]|nr:hypothetical protein [Sphingomonas sp. OK281]SFN67238.1 hypothetical protein SAMN05428984_0073 [Sphingomonas sp. OK281]